MKIFKMIKEFGFKFVFKYYFNSFFIKFMKSNKSKLKKNKLVDDYLNSKYLSLLPKNSKVEKIDKNFKVWVFWYQGQDHMPRIVKACVDSIKQNFKNNEVVLITKANYKDYVSIPDYIIEKIEKKVITLTHFSDILRASLLAKYGGLWIDSTIYLTGDISQEIEKHPFYTIKLKNKTLDTQLITYARWSGFFMSGAQGNPLFIGLRDVLYEYWKEHNVLVNYFLIDFIINFLYDNVDAIKDMIDNVPQSNENLFTLADLLFTKYDEAKFLEMRSNTKVFKLTYKFKEKQTKLKETFYQELVK